MRTTRLTARAVGLAGLVALASACGGGTLDRGSAAGGGATGNGGAGASVGGVQPDGGQVCPPLCKKLCPGGNVIDANGCPTCECKPLPCDGTIPETCTDSIPQICECDPGRACAQIECGGPPPPAQPMPCPDGSVPPFDCVRGDDRRTCGWRVRQCPAATLEQSLQGGYWQTGMDIGNCTEVHSFLRFVSSGQAESIAVNNNACYPAQRGTTASPVSYSLNGRTLTMSQQTSAQLSAIAIGTLDGSRVLFHQVYLPVTATSWRGHAITEQRDAAGVTLWRTDVTVDLSFAAPLPVTGSGSCRVSVAFTSAYYTLRGEDGRDLPPDARDAMVTGNLPSLTCRYGPGANGQQVELGGIDFSAQPGWAQHVLGGMVHPIFWLNPAEPSYLLKATWYDHRDSLPPIR